MSLIPVIGLETHVQLKTRSKLFCACPAHAEGVPPNTHVCQVCLGHPGVLPVTNEQAVRWAVLLGLALNGTVTPHSKFDRKNYFYPDLPKAYQISQFDLPIMRDGFLDVDVNGESVRIGLERLHLEEDAAKNIHGEDGKTYVDFNRSSVALCEIVTRPDFTSAAQAKAYLQELRLLVRTLGVSDGDMEKGHLRCDVNISLRETGGPLMPKTEIKNVNSFRHVERAIAYEIQRQNALWEAGTPPMQTTTRGWNDVAQRTDEQRVKEGMGDYRYFPEPDVPPLALAEIASEMRRTMPELPAAKRRRLQEEYGFKAEDARQIVDDPALADFTEHAMSELAEWAENKEDVPKLTKIFSGWLLSKLAGLLAERGSDIRIAKVTPENFAEFVKLLADGKITGTKGLEVLNAMLESGADPEHAMQELGAKRMDDVTALREVVETVIAENPKEADRYKAGETKLAQFFLGQVMKAAHGNADPGLTMKVIVDVLR